ncbi:MAG: hypothetical protein EOO11_09695 [Chitinophagaceae bacterium]|nr:MAG: hypothetical protein EOO11_09695 [Chitinophagaceae bacterium]
MRFLLLFVLACGAAGSANAQTYAITCEGQKVILYANGTWRNAANTTVPTPPQQPAGAGVRYRLVPNSTSFQVLRNGQLVETITYRQHGPDKLEVGEERYEKSFNDAIRKSQVLLNGIAIQTLQQTLSFDDFLRFCINDFLRRNY